jgi:hypothetical protein
MHAAGALCVVFIRPREAGEGDHAKRGGGGDAMMPRRRSTKARRIAPLPPSFARFTRYGRSPLPAKAGRDESADFDPGILATDRLSHTCGTVLHCRISAWIRGSSPRMTVQRSRTP